MLPLRRSALLLPIRAQPRCFSTTAHLRANPSPKAKGFNPQASKGPMSRQVKVVKKNTKEEPKKAKFAIGERKKIKNTIVLSNTNAPRLPLPEFTEELIGHEAALGSVFALPDSIIDKLRVLEAFRRTQDWKFFSRPSTVLRKETMWIGEAMGDAVAERYTKTMILAGPKGSGKSILLLQTMTWALQKEWVVIHIPNAQDLVIGHTEYELDIASGLWAQREYTAALLRRICRANTPVLTKVPLSRDYTINRQTFQSSKTNLHSFAEMGARDSALSHEIFVALLSELSLPNRPHTLFALDNINQISLPSNYRDPDFNIIHAHDLAIPHYFLAYLRGERNFQSGGLVVAATSSNCVRTEALDFALSGVELEPYSKLDRRIAPSIAGADVMHVEGMEKEEAVSLLDYCKSSGLSVPDLNDSLVQERMILTSGLPKELVASCVRIRV